MAEELTNREHSLQKRPPPACGEEGLRCVAVRATHIACSGVAASERPILCGMMCTTKSCCREPICPWEGRPDSSLLYAGPSVGTFKSQLQMADFPPGTPSFLFPRPFAGTFLLGDRPLIILPCPRMLVPHLHTSRG